MARLLGRVQAMPRTRPMCLVLLEAAKIIRRRFDLGDALLVVEVIRMNPSRPADSIELCGLPRARFNDRRGFPQQRDRGFAPLGGEHEA